MTYATVDDVAKIWRRLTMEEMGRAEQLIPIVSDALRVEAKKAGKNLDQLAQDPAYASVLKSVIVDITSRILATSTDKEPMTQYSQSALGYSWTGHYLAPGGGLYIKKTELDRLGLNRQKYGVIDLWA